MHLRVFQADSIAEAMRKVRQELGDDAIIVSTHKVRRGNGVEVTAAVETPAEQAPQPIVDPIVRPAGRVSSPLAAAAETIAKTLSYHGVAGRLVERICIAALDVPSDATTPEQVLTEALRATLRFQPLHIAERRPIMLVGPPGVGKTVTAAKVLARDVIAGIQTRAITCDTLRAGGVEQLAAFTRVMDVTLTSVDSPTELSRALTHLDGRVLIDTAGTNPYDNREVQDLKALIAAANAEPVLVLTAGGDPTEAAEIAALFSGIGVSRLIVTRLDATRRIGGLLNAADGAHLSLADVSLTPFVGEGLHALSPAILARLLLRDPRNPTDRSAFVEPES